MKVMELIKLLEDVPGDTEVILASDAEGNSYSPVAELTEGTYFADTTYSGEFYSDEETEASEDDIDEEHTEDGVVAIVLWPTN